MLYNELGQEIERILPGNVISQWQYDVTGRPTSHRISSQNRHTRRRVYNWDVNHRLKSMVNELTAGQTTYGYDEFSNLVWSNEGNPFDFLHRNVDDVGNLYETKEKTDRVYGAGSRLLETKDAKFSYDEEGNLVQKVEKNGDTWQYEYTGNGMMSKVIKPDQTEVTFKYDSLGRRIEKSSNEKTTRFVWDGNTILHEYFLENDPVEPQNKLEIPDNVVTWVFNDGFVPSAKITGEGNYSIISDYLGTPVEAYDEEGKKVWSAELDIYGRVKEFTGEKDFIPFRYQGQYEDIEIGLYYNRFRYYDPEQGNYTQIDPIGLAGGNPTLYGYVGNPNKHVDTFGLYNGEGVRELGIYDVFHSHLLKSSEFTNTDTYHFSKANESLHKAFQNDPAFKAAMEAQYPGVSKHVASTRMGTYRGTAPKGITWHHATSSQVDGQKGWLQLVDQKYHKIYHPDDIGGRNEWGGGTSCRKK
ncbi:RHS repeat-associated core domain-containing protein [Sporosarcina sp. FSL K6-3457]|uniref:RHS repeat-associated core domain-containing protein n=1 Tax=Sporosarcina sp. FSL K6-3457 TaxID=2978204 RepID=UPI0030F9BBC9